MTLPTIAYLFQEFFDGRDDRRMLGSNSRQTFGIGQPGQLVQVAGDAFELRFLFQGTSAPADSRAF